MPKCHCSKCFLTLAASVLAGAICVVPLIFSSTLAQSQEAPMLGIGGKVMLAQPKAVAVETQKDDLNGANELLQAENYKQAAPLLEKLSAQGNAVAKYKLAELYFRGLGVSQDDRMAAILYEAAAEQNVLYAQQNIAVMYVNGRGVNRDFTKAVYWFRKAALQGDAFAQLSLGNRYLNGEGVAQNYKEALSWFKKAADQGYAPAYYVTGMMYLHGKGVQQDIRRRSRGCVSQQKADIRLPSDNLGLRIFMVKGSNETWCRLINGL
jgi:TPR repeat protein